MAKSNKFGTFGGVFAPSILTILGVIMYLRLPSIVGEAGLWATIGIIVIAHIISVTTGLSVSSIATDKKVKAGGTYYMISRSLGLPIGGTLGLALFVGLSFSVSLYLIGFSESFLSYWGFDTGINNIRVAGTIVLLAVTIVTFISTSLALKTQYFIMAAIVLSLVSIFMGVHEFKPTAPLFSNPTSTVPLMVLFGIFFPAVTGFEAGVSMSGDLKDPKKSIPRGSIAAIVVGFVVYILLAFYFSYTVDGAALAGDSQILLKISRFPELVVAGIWGATLSSALGSILGAPRILQATALDKITGRFFAKGYGASNEPRNALLFTFLIAEAGILIGELDVIARVVSVFFITTYGFLNLSCAFETWTSADFRPQFKVSGWISLIGAIACFIVMIELDFVATIVASLLLSLLFLYLKRKELTLDSGDAWSSIWASLVKKGLQRLTKDKLTGRNWRPNVLLFSGKDDQRPELLETGKLLTGNMGILSSFELIESKEEILPKPKIIFDDKDKASGFFKHQHVCRDIFGGMEEISRIYGFSGVQPNTILMGWSRDLKHRTPFIKTISGFEKQNYNTLFLNYNKERAFGDHQTIDVWWNGSGRNLAFAIYLLRHLTSSLLWKPAKIRICYINEINSDRDQLVKSFNSVLTNYRLQAEVEIINNELDQFNTPEIIIKNSLSTDLVIIGLPDGQQQMRYDQINPILDQLGSTLLINASKQFEDVNIQAGTSVKSDVLADSDHLVSLPDLRPGPFPLLAADMQKTDDRGLSIMDALHEKLFAPLFAQNIEASEKLAETIKGLEKNLDIARSFSEGYRQKRQLNKAKNDFLFSIKRYLKWMNEYSVEEKFAFTNETLEWYSQQLSLDVDRFPVSLKLRLEETDIAAKADDERAIRRIKFKKRLQARSGRKTWLKLNYRKLVQSYLKDERHVALKTFLDALLKDEGQFHKLLKDEIDRVFDLWERIDIESAVVNDPFEEIIQELKNAADHQKNLSVRYANRLRLDARKHVQVVSNRLSSLDANEQHRKFKKNTRQLKSLAAQNLDFGARLKGHLQNQVNKMYADVAILGLRTRVEEKMNDFKFEMINSVQKGLDGMLTKLEEGVRDAMVKGYNEPDTEVQNKLHLLFENEVKTFDQLVNELPETLELMLMNEDSEEEIVPVPLRKMGGHYLNNLLILPTQERLEALSEQLKNTFVACREMVSLVRFSMNNLDDEDEENTVQRQEEYLEECHEGIDVEREAVHKLIEAFLTDLDHRVQTAFEPLSTLKLLSTSANFARYVLGHQGQQVKSGVLDISKRISQFSTRQLSRLLYSRSRGLIFAKKLADEPKPSVTSRLLDCKEQLTPDSTVLKALPGYYTSLFSGRSTIDRTFWIKRPVEEMLFKKAIQRYNEGFYGAVLVIGERNSGKTTFSRFQALKYYKANRCFQVFPKPQGSEPLQDFCKSLNEATGISGQIDEVMNTVPEGSVFVINDLEIWWQRSEEGLSVVRKLCELIDDFGRKCLFIVNINPHAAKLINQMMAFNDYFIEIISCRAFESAELKDLIMARHQSTGLPLTLASGKESISELGMAKLFDGYFSVSKGNPGVALNSWLSNIVTVKNELLVIKPAQSPGLGALREISPDWQLVLVQLILHKKLSFERLQNTLMMEKKELDTILLAMFRAGLLVEERGRVYTIDPWMEPLVSQVLGEKELI